MRASGDRGDIVLGWLTKLVAVLAVLGLLGFDAVSLALARFTAEDHAQQAARAAAATFSQTHVPQAAYDAALGEVVAHGDTIDPASFATAQDGAVTLTLSRTAPTLLLERIPQLRGWTQMSATVTGRPAV
jgi:hypothetical protein